jgi:glucose-1-phosphate thymidylyltransferase
LDNIKARNNGAVDSLSKITGEVSISKNCQVINSIIKGPAIIGNNTIIMDSYIGPFSSIGENCIIKNTKIESSIIMEECELENVDRKIKYSLLGKNVKIISSSYDNNNNNNARFLLGDQSYIELID